jgi:hypothetical protein
MVLDTRFDFSGADFRIEDRANVRGAVVDADGLIVLENDAAGGDSTGTGTAMLARFGASVKVVASDVRVTFADEGKEYPAVLVARDTNLDLAYVRILDLEGRKVTPVDFASGPVTRTGDPLLLVTRKSRGFDCAALLLRCYASMRVERPRPMWEVTGDVVDKGLPLYDRAGRFAGLVVGQAGSEGGTEENPFENAGTFLLPPETFAKSLAAAKARVPEALAAAKKAREAADSQEPSKEPEAPK